MPDFSITPFRPEVPLLGDRYPRPSTPATKGLQTGDQQPKEISFRDSVRNFVHDVDGMQKDAGKKVQDFIAGEISDVHDVMVAVEKANTSFQLLMELRNKFLDAYQEIKRMQI
ncbi:MAG: flagellar hook-basal body complex protein FliE [Candidatus Glassbacteria bacterium]|nr:flagellar hook-basal body complex protein FliE [Candidatus Glassbacteria bacterium]